MIRKFKTTFAPLLAILMFASLLAVVSADGTETLGTPGIAIAAGSGIAVGGDSMNSQPSSISVDVPVGASIKQVLIYWQGASSSGSSGIDDTIVVDGTEVTGTIIGGPKQIGNVFDTTLRADITGLGVISDGPNSVAVDGVSFGVLHSGAGIVVIFDDGSGGIIDIRDGQDFAYLNLGGDLKVTVPQTFTFAPSPVDRVAELSLSVIDVSPNRPNSVDITVGATTTTLINPFPGAADPGWEILETSVNVPAGETSVEVQVISGATGDSGQPASLVWEIATFEIGPPADPSIGIEKFTLVVPLFGDAVCNGSKPQLLTMEYIGGSAISPNTQEGKAQIKFDAPLGFPEPVRIIASDKDNPFDGSAKVWFDSLTANVNQNNTFEIDATNVAGENKLKADTRVHILDGSDVLLQTVKFHTSCSKPLNLGDQFGGVKLIEFLNEDGSMGSQSVPTGLGEDADDPDPNVNPVPMANVGDPIIWSYVVTNTGNVPLLNVVVTDDQGVAVSCPKSTPIALGVGESMTCTASGLAVEGLYANIGKAENVVDFSSVMDTDPSHYIGNSPPVVCEARPEALVMMYVGGNEITQNQEGKVSVLDTGLETTTTDPAKILAFGKSDGSGGTFFEGTVNLGATFVIDAINVSGRTELESDTLVKIYTSDMNTLLQTITFHTSCSKLLRLNDRFGGIKVAGWIDKDGNMVGIQPPPPPPLTEVELGDVILVAGSPELKKGGKHLVLDLENTSTTGGVARIDEIVLDWPVGNGKLKKIKLAGNTIFDTDIPQSQSPKSITSFLGSTGDRSFGPGNIVELKFEFDNDDGVSLSDYDLDVDFGKGLEQVIP